MRISPKLAAVAAFFVIGAAVAGCGSSIPGNSVATVAGNPITLQAFNHWVYVAAKEQSAQAAQQGQAIPVIVPDPPKYNRCIAQIRAGIPQLAKTPTSTLRTDCDTQFKQDMATVMNFLIEGYWFQAQAYKAGIKPPTDTAFEKALKKQYPTKSALQTALGDTGQTKQDLAFQYRVQMLYSKLLKRYESKPTSAAILAYYKAHKSQFGTPESRDLNLIRTKTQAQAQAAYNALNSGQSWKAVAKQYASDASAKANGGALTGITSGEEESAVNSAIFGNPVNKLVGPVKGIFGYYVLEVNKITPAQQESLAKATPTIKSLLQSSSQTKAETKVQALAKKAWLKKTTCRTNYQVATCSNYKAPKTTTTPAATTPSVTVPNSTSTKTTGSSSTTSTKTATTATTTTK